MYNLPYVLMKTVNKTFQFSACNSSGVLQEIDFLSTIPLQWSEIPNMLRFWFFSCWNWKFSHGYSWLYTRYQSRIRISHLTFACIVTVMLANIERKRDTIEWKDSIKDIVRNHSKIDKNPMGIKAHALRVSSCFRRSLPPMRRIDDIVLQYDV